MSRTRLVVWMVGAATIAGPLAAQEGLPLGRPLDGEASCGAALLADQSVDWLSDEPLAADFDLDGRRDVVLWGVRSDQLVIRVARCAGDEVVRDWRYPFASDAGCDARMAEVATGSLLLDGPMVERVCARGEGRDECIHLRRENDRRRELMARGGRAISVVAPRCLAMDLVWDARRGGFMRMPRP